MIILAGAGMRYVECIDFSLNCSVESTPPIPTLVSHSFLATYPSLAERGLTIFDISNYSMLEPKYFIPVLTADLFHENPQLAWGVFAKRMQDYHASKPHEGECGDFDYLILLGYFVLKKWAESRPFGYYVYTTNLDKQFLKSGFSNVFERHGILREVFPCSSCRLVV